MAAGFLGLLDFTGLPVGRAPTVVKRGFRGVVDWTGISCGRPTGAAPSEPSSSARWLSGKGSGARRRRLPLLVFLESIPSSEAFGTPTVRLRAEVSGVGSGEGFGVPMVKLAVRPAEIEAGEVGGGEVKLRIQSVDSK